MKLVIKAIAALSVLASFAATSALAQTAPPAPKEESNIYTYASGGYSLFNGGDVKFSAVTLRGGVMFNPNFGVELEASKGIGTGEVDINNFGISSVDVGLDYQISAFAIGRIPVGNKSNLFARIGYSSANLTIDVPAFSGSSDLELKDVIWGLGGEYYFNNHFGVRGEVTGFKAEGKTIDNGLDIYSISLVAKF